MKEAKTGVAYEIELPPGTLELRDDEVEYLMADNGYRRCKACGHLSALHNGHCCLFCTVPGCDCSD